MTSPITVERVRIVDNGLRSFVPPCFCFELHAETGLVATVSQIALPSGEILESGFGAVAGTGFDPDALHDGSIEPYAAGPRNEQGLRFTVATG